MLIKPVMDHLGSTNERLREVFTTPRQEGNPAPTGDKADRQAKDWKTREFFEEEISARLEEGMRNTMRLDRIYRAVDLALDTSAISKETIPLMLYAQGKIDREACGKQLDSCGCGGMVRKDSAGKVIDVDLPSFVKFSFNLIRSIHDRRVAAQNNKYANLWPHYDFFPSGVDTKSKLQADAVSMVVDAIVDEFGDRHHNGQCVSYGFGYGRCFDFKRASWEVEYHTRFVGEGEQMETVPVAQGICFVNPHPSRVFYDAAFAPQTINTDKGCQWLGYWDIVRKSSIVNNPAFYNTDQITSTSVPWQLYWAHLDYFDYYYDTIFPPLSHHPAKMKEMENDRALNFGNDTTNSTNDGDESVFVCQYYRKLVPKDFGIGEYPHPVWVRFTATADGTVVYAEFVYSRPAAYLGLGEDDNRLISPSQATLLFGLQDAMTNLCTQLFLMCQLESMGVFVLNIAAFQETPEGKAMVDGIRKRLKGQDWSGNPHVLEVDLGKMSELLGNDASAERAVIDIKRATQSSSIQTIINAMAQVVTLTDRVMNMSPAEMGQPAPREISATEVVAMNNTTSSVYDAISNDIDTFMAAKKRIYWESLLNCWEGGVSIPLKHRYDQKTITDAGFEVSSTDGIIVRNKQRTVVTGHVKSLIPEYPFMFSSRDGAERVPDTAAAQSLVQLLQYAMQVPEVLQAMGKDKLFAMFNEVARLLGVSKLIEMEPGESDQFGGDEMEIIKNVVAQIEQALPQIQQVLQEMDGRIGEQEQANAQQEEALKRTAELAQLLGDIQTQVQRLESDRNIKPPEIPYKDAPDSVKAQLEARAGLQPALRMERTIKEGEPLPSV